jgi:hypothetical protein
MPFPFTAEELLHFIPLAIGYAIILILFLRSRRDMIQSREPAAEASAVPNFTPEEQGIHATDRRTVAASLAAAAAAAAQRDLLAARAELLRTYRRAESSPRIATALAAAQRR